MNRAFMIAFVFLLTGCATSFEQPRNISDMSTAGYLAERASMSDASEGDAVWMAMSQNDARCTDLDLAPTQQPIDAGLGAAFQEPEILSPGDMLQIEIVKGEGFAGNFVISPDGFVRLPFLGDVPAAGGSQVDLENAVARLLVSGGFFRSNFVQVSVGVMHWAPIRVSISGAVFQTGDVLLNERQADRDPTARVDARGDIAFQRHLSTALAASAGVRPDADIRNVVLTRNGRRRVFDMSGVLDGGPVEDPLLAAGDRVHVPSRGCFQISLARPSRITPPGIRVFMSNLTQPSASNANSAIGQHASQLPYGTRLLQGLVSANCVGGIQATNAQRWAVLISRNPISGESEVIARSIEGLVRRSDRDHFNPVLLPNDAIACYDSHVTNVRDVIAMVSEVVSPFLNAALIGGAL